LISVRSLSTSAAFKLKFKPGFLHHLVEILESAGQGQLLRELRQPNLFSYSKGV
jgi:hypothetical protein